MIVVTTGDKVYVVIRRAFERDVRRHFAGTVVSASDVTMLVEGYAYVHDPAENSFVKDDVRQSRIISLVSSGTLVHLLPSEVDMGALEYEVTESRTFVTDGSDFRLAVHEFGAAR